MTPPLSRKAGFTLVELMVALAIAGMLAVLSAPLAMRMYDTMQYQSVVRDMLNQLATARHGAIVSGESVDMVVLLSERRYGVGERLDKTLPESIKVEMITARELSRHPERAVIRFYPDGGSSGGSIELKRTSTDAGVRLRVDWLLGRTTHEALTP